MGAGSWTAKAYTNAMDARGFSTAFNASTNSAVMNFTNVNASQYYVARKLDEVLNPYKVIRECRDNAEHPNTIPVLLGLDITGSMGKASVACAAKLNEIITLLYEKVRDVEFLTCAIGDLSYDNAPFQVSQFESDIRILDQLDKVYFEGGGGGNGFESYTLPWFFGLHQTKLDCWNRGQKGIIITLGDEPLNPYLPKKPLIKTLGCSIEANVDTKQLYEEASKKFDIYHLAIDDPDSSYDYHKDAIHKTWGALLGDNFMVANLNNLSQTISKIITTSAASIGSGTGITVGENGISW